MIWKVNQLKNIVSLNSRLLFISYSLSKVINYGWGILTARMLSVSEFGFLTYYITIASFIDVISDLGTSNYILRKYSIKTDESDLIRELSNGLLIRTALFFISIAGFIFVWRSINFVFIIVCLSIYFQNITTLYIGFFRSKQIMKVEANSVVLVRFILLIMTILVFLFNKNILLLISISMFISNIIGFIYIMIKFVQYIGEFKVIEKVKYPELINQLKKSLPFALTIILTTIYYRIDVFFIEKLKGINEVGIYNAAYKFIDISLIIPMVLVTPILPIISKFYRCNKDKFYSILNRYINILGSLGGIGCLTINILSSLIIYISYGSNYKESSILLTILGYTLFFQFINYLIEYSLNISNYQKFVNFTAMLAIIINIILNIIFIPNFGAVGAAYNTVVTSIIMNLVNLFYLYFILKVKIKINLIFQYLIVIISIVLNIFFYNYFINIVILLSFILISMPHLKLILNKEVDTL